MVENTFSRSLQQPRRSVTIITAGEAKHFDICERTRPLRMTTILSARFTVLRRCAMRMTVIPPRAIMLSIACCTRCSLSASNALHFGGKPEQQQ